MKKIQIDHICRNLDNRPKFHHEIREYLAQFVFDNFVQKFPTLLRTKYDYIVVIGFDANIIEVENGGTFFFSNPFFIEMLNAKSVNVNVPFNITLFNTYENKLYAYVQIVFFAVLAVFDKEFKSVKFDINSEVESLVEKVDVKYLESFAYPAKFADQKFLDDLKTSEVIL